MLKNKLKKILVTIIISSLIALFPPSSNASSIFGGGGSSVNVTATNGTANLGASFTVTAAFGTWQNVGLSITLPAAGTYLLQYSASGTVVCTTGTNVLSTRLYNTTDAVVVDPTSVDVVTVSVINQTWSGQATVYMLYTVAASKVINLQAGKAGGAACTLTVNSGTLTSNTSISYTKL